ncbi:MAG: hypothetical protein ACKO0W_01160 [Planctomycetota bacterium]
MSRLSFRTALSRACPSACAVLCSLGMQCAVPAIALVAAGTASPEALAAVAPPKERDFTPSELRLWRDPESGKHFWYLTYDVVNNTGKDQRFAPRIELFVDDGAVIAQGTDVPSSVTKGILRYLNNPLVLDHFEILGEVLQGKEHAKTGLVVFPAASLDPTELTVFIAGLSQETKKEKDPKGERLVTLRKTMRLDYLVPGDPKPVGTTSYGIVAKEWIFR